MAIILKANKVNLFVSSILFIFWYHSPNLLETPSIFHSKTLIHEAHRLQFASKNMNKYLPNDTTEEVMS
jgi:hypothetical protein